MFIILYSTHWALCIIAIKYGRSEYSSIQHNCIRSEYSSIQHNCIDDEEDIEVNPVSKFPSDPLRCVRVHWKTVGSHETGCRREKDDKN